jgi:hypothetical protein
VVVGPFADRHIAAGGAGPGEKRLIAGVGDDAVASFCGNAAFALRSGPFAHGLVCAALDACNRAAANGAPASGSRVRSLPYQRLSGVSAYETERLN